MTARTGARLAWMTFGLVAVSFVGSVVLLAVATQAGAVPGGELAEGGALLAMMFSFPVVGVLVAAREPDNPIGWLLLAIGLVWEVWGGVAGIYVIWGFDVDPGSLPRPDLVAALTSSIWVPGLGLIGTFLILLFPDGRLPTPRWRPFAWFCGLVLFLLTVLIPLAPVPVNELGDPSLPAVANPLSVEALGPFFEGPVSALLLLLPLCTVACAWSLIRRFRRSRGHERLQLKWLASGAGAVAALFLFSIVASFLTTAQWGSAEEPGWLTVLDQIGLFSFLLIPAAVGTAILRHRLYDIDVIINRALVYGALTAVLALVYVAGVVGVGGTLREVSGQESNSFAVAASTLAVAGLFRPARGRVQGFIDRRFYRSRYDATRTVEEFSRRVRDEVTLDTVTSDLLMAVNETVQPEHASLWLRSGTL
ncbi:hypothetical protein BH20ACT21_BH20ACT21_18530 [soil metagenome]